MGCCFKSNKRPSQGEGDNESHSNQSQPFIEQKGGEAGGTNANG